MPRYGQHFLVNPHAIERIVDALNITNEKSVLEIGPGKGALTAYLLKNAKKVVGVEVDDVWVSYLTQRYGQHAQFQLIHKDILDFDLKKLEEISFPWRVAGNLPYNLTSPILRRLCSWNGWDEAVVMVQKEVGDRLVAQVGTSAYSALTVGVGLSCRAERIFDLSPASFNPAPKVASTVIRLTRHVVPLDDNIDHVQKIIQAAFQQRRKTILNSLSHGLQIDKNKISLILKNIDIQENERPERLSITKFIQLSNSIRSMS